MNSIKTFIEIEVEVFFDYQPFEPQTLTDPECLAEIQNMDVDYKGISMVALDQSIIEDLESQCMEDMNSE